MSDVVRLDAGSDAVRAYVSGHAQQGKAHVIALVREDNFAVVRLIADLTQDEGMTVTPVDEWRIYDILKHLSASLDRSRTRLATLSSGRPFENPIVQGGSRGSVEYESFQALRSGYIDGMADIIAVIREADGTKGLDLTADHAQFGPFNWLEWATYSHHVHTHDHIGQLTRVVEALRPS